MMTIGAGLAHAGGSVHAYQIGPTTIAVVVATAMRGANLADRALKSYS